MEAPKEQAPRYIKQLSFFVKNRLGALQEVVSKLEEKNVQICAVSILEAADHAVIRMVVNRPSVARLALEQAGYSAFETALLGVLLPPDPRYGIGKVLASLLIAEVNVGYVYSLIVQVRGRPTLALNVDDLEWAGRVLREAGFDLVGQEEIGWEEPGAE